MPLYEYKCETPDCKVTERIVGIKEPNEPKSRVRCKCGRIAHLIQSLTGKPILKRGIGGFYAPTTV